MRRYLAVGSREGSASARLALLVVGRADDVRLEVVDSLDKTGSRQRDIHRAILGICGQRTARSVDRELLVVGAEAVPVGRLANGFVYPSHVQVSCVSTCSVPAIACLWVSA